MIVEASDDDRPRARACKLMRCGSVWDCPICSWTISARRTREVQRAFRWAAEHNLRVLAVCKTVAHHKGDRLRAVRELHRAAERYYATRRGSTYRELREAGAIRGWIRGTEPPVSPTTGWHVHTHEGLFLDEAKARAVLGAAGFEKLGEILMWEWCQAVGHKNGRAAFHAQDARWAEHVDGSYLTKWGVPEELGRGILKEAKGDSLHPFQLLDRPDDAWARAAFHEYSAEMAGKTQLRWAPGFKQLVGIEEIPDSDAAEAADDAATWREWCRIPRSVWYAHGGRVLVPLLLDAAEAAANPDATGPPPDPRVEAVLRAARWADGWDAYGRAEAWRRNAGAGVPFGRAQASASGR